MSQELKEKLVRRAGALKTERTSWLEHWRTISKLVSPRQGRYFVTDRNKGGSRINRIIDNTATRDLRVLGAGMMAGATSPSRQWFKLASSDLEKNQSYNAKIWLHNLERLYELVYQKSNTYRVLHSTYQEMGAFGTSANLLLPDDERIIHHYPISIGEYCLASNYKGKVDTIYREFQLTVHELVAQFGYKSCSHTVQTLYDRGNLDSWVTVTHAIEPRVDRDRQYLDAKNMPYLSCYFENGSDEYTFLRESGYNTFPCLAPRWELNPGDIYGHSPGMECLGDVSELQVRMLQKGKAIDYQVNPPIQKPYGIKNRDIDFLPGGVTTVRNPNDEIKESFQVKLNLDHVLNDIMDIRQRIHGSFYADLFLVLTNATETRMTATEVAERHEEKLLLLGPVIERLQNELLSPLIDITFNIMQEQGLIPPPPPELEGTDLTIEFTSILAQAQKAVGSNTMDRFVMKISEVAQFKPEVLDKFDHYEWADDYGDMLGVNPKIIVPTDIAMQVAQQRAEQQQQAQQAEIANQASGTAKNMAETPTANGESDLLSDVTNIGQEEEALGGL